MRRKYERTRRRKVIKKMFAPGEERVGEGEGRGGGGGDSGCERGDEKIKNT